MSVIFNNPLNFEIGTGISGSLNGIYQSTMSLDASDTANISFDIPQNVDESSDVTFNEVSASGNTFQIIGTPESNIVLHYSGISGSGTVYGELNTTQNFTASKDVRVLGKVTAEEMTVEATSSSTIYKSGSTKFGDTLDDTHPYTGSLKLQNLKLKEHNVSEISNDSTLLDKNPSDLITEYAALNYFESLRNFQYLRKCYVHKGTIQSPDTVYFNAVTASNPVISQNPTAKDFLFFVNGFNAETDALSIQQNASNMVLTINTSSLGYGLTGDDEIVAMGKFNS